MNLHRTPFGGRHFECFSEDPLAHRRDRRRLRARAAGARASPRRSSTSSPTTPRPSASRSTPCVDERTLRELYLAPFEPIVASRARGRSWPPTTRVNGPTMTESPLLRDVLKDEWGFDGVVMSDWGATRSLNAAAAALDLAMPGPAGPWGDELVRAVERGEIPEATVDDKVLRLLRLAERVGALDTRRLAGRRHPRTPRGLSAPHGRDVRRGVAGRGGRRRAARHRGRVLRARAQPRRAAPAHRADSSSRRGHRPERGRRPHARRRQRNRLPALHRLAPGRAARGASDTPSVAVRARGARPHPPARRRRQRGAPLPRRRRHAALLRAARDRRVHVARHARSRRDRDRGPHDADRRAGRRALRRLLRRGPLPAHARRRRGVRRAPLAAPGRRPWRDALRAAAEGRGSDARGRPGARASS